MFAVVLHSIVSLHSSDVSRSRLIERLSLLCFLLWEWVLCLYVLSGRLVSLVRIDDLAWSQEVLDGMAA